MVTLSLINRPQSDPRQATGAWAPRKREDEHPSTDQGTDCAQSGHRNGQNTDGTGLSLPRPHRPGPHPGWEAKPRCCAIAASPTNRSTHNNTQAVGENCVTAASATTCTEANVPSMIEAGTFPAFFMAIEGDKARVTKQQWRIGGDLHWRPWPSVHHSRPGSSATEPDHTLPGRGRVSAPSSSAAAC